MTMLLWALSLLLCANPGGQAQKRRYSPGNQVLPPAVPPVPQQFPIPGSGTGCMEWGLGAQWRGAEWGLRDGVGSSQGFLSGVLGSIGMEQSHPNVF